MKPKLTLTEDQPSQVDQASTGSKPPETADIRDEIGDSVVAILESEDVHPKLIGHMKAESLALYCDLAGKKLIHDGRGTPVYLYCREVILQDGEWRKVGPRIKILRRAFEFDLQPSPILAAFFEEKTGGIARRLSRYGDLAKGAQPKERDALTSAERHLKLSQDEFQIVERFAGAYPHLAGVRLRKVLDDAGRPVKAGKRIEVVSSSEGRVYVEENILEKLEPEIKLALPTGRALDRSKFNEQPTLSVKARPEARIKYAFLLGKSHEIKSVEIIDPDHPDNAKVLKPYAQFITPQNVFIKITKKNGNVSFGVVDPKYLEIP